MLDGIKFVWEKKSEIHAGIDISSEGFTLVSISEENGKFSLNHLYTKTFKEEIMQNGMVSRPDLLTEALKKALEEHNIDIKSVNISVSGGSLFIKTVSFPEVPLEELKIIAPQEACKHVPQTINEINVDFQMLEKSANNKVDAILCALPKDVARNFVDSVAGAGIETTAIDISSFAMIRTLANTEAINNPDSSYVSVLVGYENTDINIVKNGMPIFSNNIQVGKKNIIEAVMKGFEINREEAEGMLPEVGLVLAGMEMNVNPANPDFNKASNILRPIYSNIAAEIQKIIEFYVSQSGENTGIERVFLGGCGICIQNIDKYIANKLKIQTELCDSLKNISNAPEIGENVLSPVNIPALSTSIGLALRGFEN